MGICTKTWSSSSNWEGAGGTGYSTELNNDEDDKGGDRLATGWLLGRFQAVPVFQHVSTCVSIYPGRNEER